jgi:hypothetical protein
VWTVARQTHHSVERAEGGGFWVPGQRLIEQGNPFPPFEPPFKEDTVLRIADDGRILDEFSVPQLFYGNDLRALLTATGELFKKGMPWDHEILHLNKVAELRQDIAAQFPMFAPGDLLLSIREMNLVMVVDPHSRAVKWWKIGPWLRQHDPGFTPRGTIVLFNNNMFLSDARWMVDEPISLLNAPAVSNIVEVDPASGRSNVLYGGAGHELMSAIRGKVEVTARNGLLITEFEGGRVLETDAPGRTVWEYVNRYSPTELAEITQARIYPEDYFTVTNWACPAAGQ